MTVGPRVCCALFLLAAMTMAAQVTGREVFKQAVAATQYVSKKDKLDASTTRWYIINEVALAQAKRGYYDDALDTMRRTDQFQALLFADILEIRARSGDIPGAINMVATALDDDRKWRSLEAIALVLLERGDTKGARETVGGVPPIFRQRVLRTIAFGQVKSGDLEGALRTWEEMEAGEGDGVLWEVAGELRRRGESERAESLLARIDPTSLAELRREAAATVDVPTKPCEVAWEEARKGKSDDALRRLNQNSCDCLTAYYVLEQSGRFEDASAALRRCATDPMYSQNVSPGMAELASLAAARGDTRLALKFADAVHVTGEEYEEGYLAPALRDIGRSWAMKDPQAALRWAKSRRKGELRAMALLGVAEGTP